jgi:hypothetical protein
MYAYAVSCTDAALCGAVPTTSLYDVGHQNGIDYLVTELLEGETLADRLASRRKYSATAS